MSAPAVFISYSHDSREHKDRILALSDRLRQEGIEPRGQRVLLRAGADDLPDIPITVVLNWWIDLVKKPN